MTAGKLRELLIYDPKTGVFTRQVAGRGTMPQPLIDMLPIITSENSRTWGIRHENSQTLPLPLVFHARR